MPFSGGVFTRVYTWVTDRVNGVPITASRMDQEFDGIATGLSNCITKDGTQTITANLPMNSKKLTGLADGSASGDSVHYGQVLAGASTTAEVTVASASTCNILGAASELIAISGTTTITSFGTGTNKIRYVRFTGSLTLTHNATSLILPTGLNIVTTAGDTCVVVSDGSSNARVISYERAAVGLRLKKVWAYASNDTWTKPSGLAAVEVEVIGAGGGVPGPVNVASGSISLVGGGGEGGTSRKLILAASLGATETVTVGTGSSGSSGGTSSFGAHCSATGGGAGNGMGAGSTTGYAVSGGGPGTGSGGDINIPGQAGGGAFGWTPFAMGGLGGGRGGIVGAQVTNGSQSNGSAGGFPGGGASGGANVGNGAVGSAFAGGNGVVIVKEYYSA